MRVLRIPIDLAEIEAILAVAEFGSFGEAADHLAISQSAISARIRSAEEALGVKLFHRTTRKVTITSHGERLKNRALSTLSELKSVIEEFRDEERLARGHVKVGSTPTISAIALPDLVSKFSQEFPGITVSIRDDFFGEALERVANGDVDLGLVPVNSDYESYAIDFEHLFIEKMVILAPLRHPLQKLKRVTLSDVARYPVISMPPQTAMHSHLTRAFADHGLKFQANIQTMHALSAVALVRAGHGITLMPEGVLKFIRHEEFCVLKNTDFNVGRQIAIATARGRSLQPAAEAVVNFIRENTRF